MSKTPLSGGCFFTKADLLGVFLKRRKTIVSIILSVALIFSTLLFSKPSFYAQAYEAKEVLEKEKKLEITESGGIFLGNNSFPKCSEEKKLERPREIFNRKESEFEKELYEIVGEHPIREMVPYIAKKDRKVAAFLVGIAKKESNWGKRVPTLNGQDCFNYWGYKGVGGKGTAMGYGCFSSPEEAIDKVGGRLENLVEKNLDTPGEMIVWKCGSSCSGHDPQGVGKWISDVSLYFNRISGKKA